jgi:hypothetical protein
MDVFFYVTPNNCHLLEIIKFQATIIGLEELIANGQQN